MTATSLLADWSPPMKFGLIRPNCIGGDETVDQNKSADIFMFFKECESQDILSTLYFNVKRYTVFSNSSHRAKYLFYLWPCNFLPRLQDQFCNTSTMNRSTIWNKSAIKQSQILCIAVNIFIIIRFLLNTDISVSEAELLETIYMANTYITCPELYTNYHFQTYLYDWNQTIEKHWSMVFRYTFMTS